MRVSRGAALYTFLMETYDPAIISALEGLKTQAHHEAIAPHFAAAAPERLQARYPSSPEPPEDWSREETLDGDRECCAAVNDLFSQRDVGSMRIDKTPKRHLLHIESEVEKSKLRWRSISEKRRRNLTASSGSINASMSASANGAAQELPRQLPG